MYMKKPRVCGDEPLPQNEQEWLQAKSPAYAGMNRLSWIRSCWRIKKPRVCGDEPVLRKFKAGERTKAPRV